MVIFALISFVLLLLPWRLLRIERHGVVRLCTSQTPQLQTQGQPRICTHLNILSASRQPIGLRNTVELLSSAILRLFLPMPMFRSAVIPFTVAQTTRPKLVHADPSVAGRGDPRTPGRSCLVAMLETVAASRSHGDNIRTFRPSLVIPLRWSALSFVHLALCRKQVSG
ncbi:hypothetical protein K458DRAFT_420391 [Lentithecium fluviatile CBS 122367]|uniref:Secreted protein n=1 Tax=Lentithecium fluviatile CBS 122367 TaxID=1168545 RepID=A0A6G1ITR0_9PLEO|nr:hypothetical protein K458DRAFT_420391 [Lentithecium fluviatile CBS 122367]